MAQSDTIDNLKKKLRDITLVDDILNLLEGRTYLDIVKQCGGNTRNDAITSVHNVVSFLDSIGVSSLGSLLFNKFSDFRNDVDQSRSDLVREGEQLRESVEKLEHQIKMANAVITTCKMVVSDAPFKLITEYENMFKKESTE